MQVHYARLVAAMLAHSLTQILTFNTNDFTRYSEITTVHPIVVTAQQGQEEIKKLDARINAAFLKALLRFLTL